MQNTNENFVVVFKSRVQTMKFYDYLKKNRVKSSIINTPRKLSLGCGLSVHFNIKEKAQIEYALSKLNLYSYAGIFKSEF